MIRLLFIVVGGLIGLFTLNLGASFIMWEFPLDMGSLNVPQRFFLLIISTLFTSAGCIAGDDYYYQNEHLFKTKEKL